MKINFERKNKDLQKGFTLVEVLVVVGIIGLLASVVLVGLGTFRLRGRDARRLADLREVQNALELYYAKNNKYPSLPTVSWGALETEVNTAGVGVGSLPRDPAGGDYFYCYSTASPGGQGYILGTALEDPNNPALKSSLGTIPATGFACDADFVNCTSPMYCIQF